MTFLTYVFSKFFLARCVSGDVVRYAKGEIHDSLVMVFLMGFFEFWIRHVSIYLCGRDGCMSEKLLDDTDIRSVREQCRREAMSESMGVHILQYACPETVLFYHIRDKKSSEPHILI